MIEILALLAALLPTIVLAFGALRRRASLSMYGLYAGFIGFGCRGMLAAPMLWQKLAGEDGVVQLTVIGGQLLLGIAEGLAVANVASRFERHFHLTGTRLLDLGGWIGAALCIQCLAALMVMGFDETLLGPAAPGAPLAASVASAVFGEEVIYRVGIPLLIAGTSPSNRRLAIGFATGGALWLFAHAETGADLVGYRWFSAGVVAVVTGYLVYRDKSIFGAVGLHLGMNLGLFAFWYLVGWTHGQPP